MSIPVVTASAFRTAEYHRSWALEAVHAADAYALGYTGAGTIIGIVDFNFDLESDEVKFDTASKGPDADAVALYQAQTQTTASADQHGQAVAVIAAGAKNGQGVQGLAFDAQVLAVDYFSGVNETQQRTDGVLYRVSDPWTYLTVRGARVINMSFGYSPGVVVADSAGVKEAYVLADAARAVENGALLVSSAGNDGASEPYQSARDVAAAIDANTMADRSGALIVVGAVDMDNQIASFSNRAGSTAAHYMVAPGVDVTAPWNGIMSTVSGTSFSAPLVSAAASLVLQHWPSLTARQVADILFATATDLGADGVDRIYGHGLLNVYAALQPVGPTALAVETGTAPTVLSTGAVLSAAFGDARTFRTAVGDALLVDSFGRDFTTDLSEHMWSQGSFAMLGDALARETDWHSAVLRVGKNSLVALDVKNDIDARRMAVYDTGGPIADTIQHVAMRFLSAVGSRTWQIGTGRDLSRVLTLFRQMAANMGTFSGAFAPEFGQVPGIFAAFTEELDAGTLSFGVTRGIRQGALGTPIAALRRNAQVSAALVRFDARSERGPFGVEVGGLLDDGGLLGSASHGALALGTRSATLWGTADAQTRLAHGWTMRGQISLASTTVARARGSLIDSIGPVIATSFSFGLARQNSLVFGDAFVLALHQPLRAESAPVTLAAPRFDAATGAVTFGRQTTSLVPSGREIALETNYRFTSGAWDIAADFAYGFDAGHRAGAQTGAAMLTMKRIF